MAKAEKEKLGSNPHKDHRTRLKKRFLDEGLDNFHEHNVLELALFFAIPQRDTNELAHELINKFGSLSGVLDASFESLLEVDGIGAHAATFLKMLPAISRRYMLEKTQKKFDLADREQIARYLVAKYAGETEEVVYLLLFDNGANLIDCVKIHHGNINSSSFNIRKAIEAAINKRAAGVIISHNHPSGRAVPSDDDMNTTNMIRSAFSFLNITLAAHMIVAENECVDILDKDKTTYRFII